jgi:hypothetical protein
MAELKTFNDGEPIYAGDVNHNFNEIYADVSANAQQVQNYVEGQVLAIQANVASIQSTLQANVDEVSNDLKIAKETIFSAIAPDHSARVAISSGYTAEQDGWIYYYITSSANFTTKLLINEKVAAYNFQGSGDHRAGTLRIGGMVFIAKGQKVTLSRTGDGNTLTFCPCKGFANEEDNNA